VVIESRSYELEIDPEPTWTMGEGQEEAQRIRNAPALTDFMKNPGAIVAEGSENHDDDTPGSDAEAKADAETEWLNRLLDRVSAGIEREGEDDLEFDKIYKEERERLRREPGIPPDPEPTPEQIAERQSWIEEMNAAAEEAMREVEADTWKERPEPQRPELLERAMSLSLQVHGDSLPTGSRKIPIRSFLFMKLRRACRSQRSRSAVRSATTATNPGQPIRPLPATP
jgi:hypothetical protein